MYDAKNTSAAHTQTGVQNQLIMVAKIAYDVFYITTLYIGISVTLYFPKGKKNSISEEFIQHITDSMSFLKTTESIAI
jgi:hypothetical protein